MTDIVQFYRNSLKLWICETSSTSFISFDYRVIASRTRNFMTDRSREGTYYVKCLDLYKTVMPANLCLIRKLFSKTSTNFLKFFFSVLTANCSSRISFDSQSTTTNQSHWVGLLLHSNSASRCTAHSLSVIEVDSTFLPSPTLPFPHQAPSACQSLCLLFPILATYNLCISSSSFPIPFHFVSRLLPTFHPSSLPRLSAHRPFLLLLLKKKYSDARKSEYFWGPIGRSTVALKLIYHFQFIVEA